MKKENNNKTARFSLLFQLPTSNSRMIDTHIHILPGLDDGARDTREAVQMAKMAVEDGITAVIATPHALNGVWMNPRGTVLEAVARFRETLQAEGVPLRVLPGSEVYFCPEVLDALRNKEIMLLGDDGRTLLLELPAQILPRAAADFIRRLLGDGVRTVLAHAERCPAVQRDPGMLKDLVKAGARVQITGMSLTGGFGKPVANLAEKLVKDGLAHYLGTDAHGVGGRPPRLAEAYRRLGKVGGRKMEARVREAGEELAG